jgi:dTDP-4-dehydrorhamnose 3,5-epimerase
MYLCAEEERMMIFETTPIPGLLAIRIERHADERGSFGRLFDRAAFAAHGLATAFTQQSLSVTRRAGTLRGMHFQRPPHAEVKFIRCTRGAIYDVVADLRPDSPSHRRWEAFQLSAEDDLCLYIPAGCAHGFQTLSDDVEVLYQMDVPYVAEAADGFRFDDPKFAIVWPRPITVIAAKDLAWQTLVDA